MSSIKETIERRMQSERESALTREQETHKRVRAAEEERKQELTRVKNEALVALAVLVEVEAPERLKEIKEEHWRGGDISQGLFVIDKSGWTDTFFFDYQSPESLMEGDWSRNASLKSFSGGAFVHLDIAWPALKHCGYSFGTSVGSVENRGSSRTITVQSSDGKLTVMASETGAWEKKVQKQLGDYRREICLEKRSDAKEWLVDLLAELQFFLQKNDPEFPYNETAEMMKEWIGDPKNQTSYGVCFPRRGFDSLLKERKASKK